MRNTSTPAEGEGRVPGPDAIRSMSFRRLNAKVTSLLTLLPFDEIACGFCAGTGALYAALLALLIKIFIGVAAPAALSVVERVV